MQEQFYTDGDVRELDGKQFECVGVSYQETDGERRNFVYNFRLKSEVDAEREVAAKLEAERLAAEEVAAQSQLSATENISEQKQPEPLKEETLNVR